MFTDRWWMQKLPNGWIHMIHDTLDGQVKMFPTWKIVAVFGGILRNHLAIKQPMCDDNPRSSCEENKTENAIWDESDWELLYFTIRILPYFSPTTFFSVDFVMLVWNYFLTSLDPLTSEVFFQCRILDLFRDEILVFLRSSTLIACYFWGFHLILVGLFYGWRSLYTHTRWNTWFSGMPLRHLSSTWSID